MESQKEIKSINDLTFDSKNFNRHTDRGMELLKKSIKENKFGRSILVDKDGNIIAGNATVETAKKLGTNKIKVVETDGDELVIVKRNDLDIDSKEARELAIADNAIAQQNLNWDTENIELAIEDYELSPEDWGLSDWGQEQPQEVTLSDEELRKLIETATNGCIEQYNNDTNYDLNNLYRRKGNKEIEQLLSAGVQSGEVRDELAKVFKYRLAQLTYFNFDELIKYYRSSDCSEVEKELLKRLYLVFITPKDAIESAMLKMEATTGRIFELEFSDYMQEDE